MDPNQGEKEGRFRFKAHAILAAGTVYPHLTALGETYRPMADTRVVATFDQGADEDMDRFVVRVDAEMRRQAAAHGSRYAENVLIGSRKAV